RSVRDSATSSSPLQLESPSYAVSCAAWRSTRPLPTGTGSIAANPDPVQPCRYQRFPVPSASAAPDSLGPARHAVIARAVENPEGTIVAANPPGYAKSQSTRAPPPPRLVEATRTSSVSPSGSSAAAAARIATPEPVANG